MAAAAGDMVVACMAGEHNASVCTAGGHAIAVYIVRFVAVAAVAATWWQWLRWQILLQLPHQQVLLQLWGRW